MSALEETFMGQITLHHRVFGFPLPEREVSPIPGRKFRFDFAWTDRKLLVEIQGGTWGKGGHSTGSGIDRDTEKLNLATIHGWRVMQFTGTQVRDGRAMKWLKAFFQEVA